MDDAKRIGRRFFLAGVGALSGLFSALGAQIILVQGGRISTSIEFQLVIAGVITGAAIGFVNFSKTGERIVTSGIAVATMVIGVFAVASPAVAQNHCTVMVTSGGRTTNLSTTRKDKPLTIDPAKNTVISFDATAAATAADIQQGVVVVSILSAEPEPLDPLVPQGGTVVYYQTIDANKSDSTLSIEKTATGFIVRGHSYDSSLLPFGLFELGIVVNDVSTGKPVKVCDDKAWVRIVSQPLTTWPGPLAIGFLFLGFAGFGALPGLKDNMTPRGPFAKGPSEGPFIPSHGKPHAPYVESRVLDARGRPISTDAVLVEGRPYRLELTINPGDWEKDEDKGEDAKVNVSGRSDDIDVESFYQFELEGARSIEIPIVPRSKGRHQIAMDFTSNGHLLQTNRLTVAVGGKEDQPTEQAQTTETVFSASDFSPTDLSQLKPRNLLVILEADDDGSVDTRVLDQDGKPVVTFDSRLQAEAITEAGKDTRRVLVEVLERGPGSEQQASEEDLKAMLIPLVKAGQQMHMAIFPRGSVLKGDVADLSTRVMDGATVQVIQTRAGLGYSTLPWNLVYDHKFLPHTKNNRLCPEFPEHPIDACPHQADHEVMCPSGFWGYRAIVEEPFVSVGTEVLTPPLGLSGTDAIGYLDSLLRDSERQASVLGKLGMERLGDFDRLLDVLGDTSRKIGFMYFYAHHSRDLDIGTQGIAIEEELLSSLTFGSLDFEWGGHPLIFINGCSSGDYSPTDPLSLLEEFRQAGAVGAITTECVMWDPLAGTLGERIIDDLANGLEVGPILRDLRRDLLRSNNNMLGFAYRLQALSETTAKFQPQHAETTIEIDLTSVDEPVMLSEDEAT